MLCAAMTFLIFTTLSNGVILCVVTHGYPGSFRGLNWRGIGIWYGWLYLVREIRWHYVIPKSSLITDNGDVTAV